jgi:cytosine deaminase
MDLVIRNARLPNDGIATDIGIEIGRIAAIEPRIVCDAPEFDAGGRLACSGHCAKAELPIVERIGCVVSSIN